MANHNKLKKSIEEMAKAKGVDNPDTNGLNKDQLLAKLQELKEMEIQTTDSESGPENDGDGEDKDSESNADASSDTDTDGDGAEGDGTESESDAKDNDTDTTESDASSDADDADTESESEPESTEQDSSAPVKEEIKPVYPFSVAPGKSITSKRGIRADGEEIKAEDLPGGEETLASLVKRGYVIES